MLQKLEIISDGDPFPWEMLYPFEAKHQVLRKPYDILALDRAVRQAIDIQNLMLGKQINVETALSRSQS